MAPERIGHYRVLSLLGAGGMGEVYRAEDTRLGRSVALKILPPDVAADLARRERFMREARAAARLTHPHIATVYDVGEADGRLYLAMELIEGETLAVRAQGQPLPGTEIIAIGAEIADALDEAHRAGIVHRDIKPANVMLDARGRAKVLDFGLARTTTLDAHATATNLSTTPGLVMGTLAYMSPEQIQGRDVDARSDIFSLGAVLYELATGVRAFAGDVPAAVTDRILHGQPDAIARFNYDVPADLERIVRKCLEKDPGRRYQSAHELVIDLRNLQRDLSATGSGVLPAATNSSARRPWWPYVIGLAVLGLLALGVVVALRPGFGSRAALAGASPQSIRSVAVLPFTNMTAQSENEYLGDGLAEEVINHLAQGGRLRVVARTSAFSFKGKTLDVRDIGKQLGVDAVLEGSVRQAGSRLRVTAQLINATDGYHFWSETFDREAPDILTLQDDISQSIAARLAAVAPSASGSPAAAPARTSNAEAYSQYLRGLHAMAGWDADGLRDAEARFEQAVRIDPEFGAAWAGIAETTVMRHEMHGVRERDEAYARATDAARRAIGARLPAAEGHAALSHILTHEYKWAAAEEEAKRAIALNPGSAIAHAWLGLVLHVTGRLADAEQATRRAVDLDPLSGQWKSNLALTLYAAGRQDETLTVARSAEQLGGVFADEIAISALLRLRRFDDARKIVERWKAAGKPAHTIDLTSSYIFAAEGRRAEAAKLIADTETARRSRSERSPELAAELVRAYAGIGNADRVFANLGPEHHATLEYFVYHWQYVPEFRALAGDPRLEAVYRLVGLRR